MQHNIKKENDQRIESDKKEQERQDKQDRREEKKFINEQKREIRKVEKLKAKIDNQYKNADTRKNMKN